MVFKFSLSPTRGFLPAPFCIGVNEKLTFFIKESAGLKFGVPALQDMIKDTRNCCKNPKKFKMQNKDFLKKYRLSRSSFMF